MMDRRNEFIILEIVCQEEYPYRCKFECRLKPYGLRGNNMCHQLVMLDTCIHNLEQGSLPSLKSQTYTN